MVSALIITTFTVARAAFNSSITTASLNGGDPAAIEQNFLLLAFLAGIAVLAVAPFDLVQWTLALFPRPSRSAGGANKVAASTSLASLLAGTALTLIAVRLRLGIEDPIPKRDIVEALGEVLQRLLRSKPFDHKSAY